ncbi:hypothetical protein GRS48_05315 [Halorubrum sp. JWXQ-INN 858]|uniref:hypothetical protein n=1 Tax=Halorubrum sp. JWXQ-INN 858 TaxID=2690782 RepID=UPI001357F933|nr:hypothetical protein [Halorubrum sp. JWXQ-INN 858]MWV64244.1 hypothetical protein [Halorubrum sp. JWXQ-INN 858]
MQLSPSIRVEEGFLSGEVGLEAWVTNTVCAPTAEYDSTRSNRRKGAFGGGADPDGDGSDDTVEARSAALELEKRLLSQTMETAASISKRSARTGRSPETDRPINERFDEMTGTIDEIRATLERCSDDVCVTVREHADGRKKLVQRAAAYAEDGEWDRAAEAVREVQAIVKGDVDLLEASLADDADAASERTPRNGRLQELTGASADEIRALYEYLEREPVLGERCVITVPDARAPRDGPTLEALITPDRLIRYVTGRLDDEGKVYSWGRRRVAMAAADDDEDEDDEDASCEGSSSGSGPSISTPLYCWGGAPTTGISGPVHTYGSLEVVRSSAGVGVVNTPPTATDERSTIGVTSDGRPTDVDDLSAWGRERGPASSTSTIVCQVLVQPAGCPCPFPALLHVQRHRSNDQYLYSCGWVIDESCLYEDSVTVVTTSHGGGGGAGKVVVVDLAAFDDGALSEDAIRRLLPDDVSPVGSQLFDGTLAEAVRVGALPDEELAAHAARTVHDDGEIHCVCTPFDGAILHLAGDANASNDVKFKAGAELSKSVN